MQNYHFEKPVFGKHYRYFNANPKKNEVDDCVIRSLAVAFDYPWLKVFDELTSIARENFTVLNFKDCYEKYLSEHEVEPIKTMTQKQRKKMTGLDFSKKYKEGRFILRMANHLSVCVDGVIYDTWDCTDKMVYKAWRVKER